MAKKNDWIQDAIGMAVVAIWEAVKGLPEFTPTMTEIQVSKGSATCKKGSVNSGALRDIATLIPPDQSAKIRQTVDGKWLFSGVPSDLQQRIRNILLNC